MTLGDQHQRRSASRAARRGAYLLMLGRWGDVMTIGTDRSRLSGAPAMDPPGNPNPKPGAAMKSEAPSTCRGSLVTLPLFSSVYGSVLVAPARLSHDS